MRPVSSGPKIIGNDWRPDGPFDRARILTPETSPQGFDVDRIRATEAGTFESPASTARILTILKTKTPVTLTRAGARLQLHAGTHLYLPFGEAAHLDLPAGAELISVSTTSKNQARGRDLLLRDETFLAACAIPGQTLRWTLTPQYLSRRVFLHHDPTLVSRSGDPVSWFHTSMFDVAGLPPNEDGEPVFKMAYNSRTELNVCYDVEGDARVRFAEHPYAASGQRWSAWSKLDNDATYYLNEPHDPNKSERNKHEIYNQGGHVSLLCMFDPAPVGIERHRPGEYSDYEPLAEVTARSEHAVYRASLSKYDAMLDALSLARAGDQLDAAKSSEAWSLYESGRAAQLKLEAELTETSPARAHIIGRWRSGR